MLRNWWTQADQVRECKYVYTRTELCLCMFMFIWKTYNRNMRNVWKVCEVYVTRNFRIQICVHIYIIVRVCVPVYAYVEGF